MFIIIVFIDQRSTFRSRLLETEVGRDESRDAHGEYIADHRDEILYVDMVTQKQRANIRSNYAAESIESGDVVIRFRPVGERMYRVSLPRWLNRL